VWLVWLTCLGEQMPEVNPLICCESCEKLDLSRTRWCTNCGGESFIAATSKGVGRLISWTVIRRSSAAFRDLGVYAVAIVDLKEGIRLIGRLDQHEPPPTIGDEVQIIKWVEHVPIFTVEHQ